MMGDGQQLDSPIHVTTDEVDAGQLLQRLQIIGMSLEQMLIGLLRNGLVPATQAGPSPFAMIYRVLM